MIGVVISVAGHRWDHENVTDLRFKYGGFNLMDPVPTHNNIHFVEIVGMRFDGVFGIGKCAHKAILSFEI